MTIDTLIMLSGAFVASLPFLGLPNSWDAALFFIAGLFVVALGIVIRRRGKNLDLRGPVSRDPQFIENIPRAGE